MSKSSTKPEYRVATCTVIETLWIHYVFAELGIFLHYLVKSLYDNITATYITANLVHHECSKHIKVDYHFMQERVPFGDLVSTYIPTQL